MKEKEISRQEFDDLKKGNYIEKYKNFTNYYQ